MSNPIKQSLSFVALLEDWLGDGARPVSKDQAQSRADICLKCPMNNNGEGTWESIKGKIADHVKQQIELKNSMQMRVDGEKSLGICDACGCVLRLKVWVPIQHIKDNTEDDTEFADGCWIMSELKPQ